jgi:hypothetical protein
VNHIFLEPRGKKYSLLPMKHVLTKLKQLSWDMSPMANWKLAHAGISPGTNQVNMGHLIVRAKLQLNMINTNYS